ncbi:hypothetical protein Poli38472_002219 [Pythium oligandrum]|uniref:Uncharacterized protein n=1 Tax=Pythium oligandrum TaxID=41045 RepID=A0A8K1CIW0_PYTOL|nr:hypothetical protein Poli38472_002219 [Pythium oligandrum]|eukprot:TMW63278.1 hypothetical protein Poli38472_002219 [Pythium oligandrum]
MTGWIQVTSATQLTKFLSPANVVPPTAAPGGDVIVSLERPAVSSIAPLVAPAQRRLVDANAVSASTAAPVVVAAGASPVSAASVIPAPAGLGSIAAGPGTVQPAQPLEAATTTLVAPTAPTTGSTVYSFRANRRFDYNNFSHGFIGGVDANVTEANDYTEKEQFSIVFGADGKATVLSPSLNKYWGHDPIENAIIWVDQAQALPLTIFTNAKQDAVYFVAKEMFFVSFYGTFSYNSNVGKCLRLMSVLTENGIFSPPSVQDGHNAIITDIVQQRRQVLQSGGEPSPAFVGYDLAFAVVLKQPFNRFKMANISDDEFGLVISVMAHTMVAYIPEYKTLYPSYGEILPGLVNLNEFALAAKIPSDEIFPALFLHTLASSIAVHHKDPIESKTASFVAAIIQRAALRDIENKQTSFSSIGASVFSTLQLYYMYSCQLARHMENATIEEKLNHTEILYPNGSRDPYLEKAGDQYWFSTFIRKEIDDLKSANVFPELGLFKYLPITLLSELKVGDGIATTITNDVTKMIAQNDIKGLSLYGQSEAFMASAAVAASVCKGSTTMKFCVIPQINAQISVLAQSDRSLFTTNMTTSLLNSKGSDLQSYMGTLYNQELNAGVIKTLTDSKNELVKFLKENVDKAASAISEATLKTSLITAKQQADSQKAMSAHLQTVAAFESNVRLEQFTQKVQAMAKGIQAAEDAKAGLLDDVKALGDKAKKEAAITAALDIIDVAFAALRTFNPVTGFDPRNLNDLLTSANEVSKSATILVQTSILTGDIGDEFGPKVTETLVNMLKYTEEVNKLKSAVDPMLNGDNIDQTKLEAHASNFLSVYGKFKPPVVQADIEEIRAFMEEIVDGFCEVIDIDGYAPCITVPGQIVKVFGSLAESVEFAQEAITALFHVASGAVQLQEAKSMGKEAAKQLSLSEQGNKDLAAKWAGDDTKKEEWWKEWTKNLQTADATSTMALAMNRAALFSVIVQFCNQDAYLAGGKPHDICEKTVFSGKPITDEQIEVLLTAEHAASPVDVDINAMIPTRPQFAQDTGFLDLSALMNQETMRFQLPTNETWLKQFQWLPTGYDLTSTVFYVRSFEIFVPPRYADYMVTPSEATVTIQSTGLSHYGKAFGGKTFAIPVDGATFTSVYETRPEGFTGKCQQVKLPVISACNPFLPKICPISVPSEPEEGTFLPSLFSPFKISMSFAGSDAPFMKYKGVTSPMYLHARVKLWAYKGVSKTVSNPTVEELAGSGSSDAVVSKNDALGMDGDRSSLLQRVPSDAVQAAVSLKWVDSIALLWGKQTSKALNVPPNDFVSESILGTSVE